MVKFKSIKKYGEKEIDVFHTYFKPLEWNLLDGRETNACYMKLISLKENKKVVGIHYLGPNAGEVIQGYSVAFKMGATKDIFERTVGIHPTCAEVINKNIYCILLFFYFSFNSIFNQRNLFIWMKLKKVIQMQPKLVAEAKLLGVTSSIIIAIVDSFQSF